MYCAQWNKENFFWSLINTFNRKTDLQDSVNILSLMFKMARSSTSNKKCIKEKYIKVLNECLKETSSSDLITGILLGRASALHVCTLNSGTKPMLSMETKGRHRFVSVRMSFRLLFYENLQQLLVMKLHLPQAELASWSMCRKRRQAAGMPCSCQTLQTVTKPKSSLGCLCSLRGNATRGHSQGALLEKRGVCPSLAQCSLFHTNQHRSCLYPWLCWGKHKAAPCRLQHLEIFL